MAVELISVMLVDTNASDRKLDKLVDAVVESFIALAEPVSDFKMSFNTPLPVSMTSAPTPLILFSSVTKPSTELLFLAADISMFVVVEPITTDKVPTPIAFVFCACDPEKVPLRTVSKSKLCTWLCAS